LDIESSKAYIVGGLETDVAGSPAPDVDVAGSDDAIDVEEPDSLSDPEELTTDAELDEPGEHRDSSSAATTTMSAAMTVTATVRRFIGFPSDYREGATRE